jgi:hypothetical protein
MRISKILLVICAGSVVVGVLGSLAFLEKKPTPTSSGAETTTPAKVEGSSGESHYEPAVSNLSSSTPAPKRCGENDGGIVTGDTLGVKTSAELRESPHKDGPKKVNEKSTAAFGKTQYQSIDSSETVRELCRQGDWSEIQVIDPSWLSDVNGWVLSRALRTFETDSTGKRVYVESYFYWDDDTKPYKSIVVKGVNKVLRENENCAKVDTGTASRSGERGTKSDPVFFVTCYDKTDRPFNVWFSASDVKKDEKLAAIKPIDHGAAVDACESAAKERATHPSTVNFSRLLYLSVLEWPSGRVKVISRFKAKNSFGLELAYDISCLFEGLKMIEVLVWEAQS